MKNRIAAISASALLTAGPAFLHATEPHFAEFNSIPASERFPKNAQVEMRSGRVCVDGAPRFIIGAILHEGVDADAGVRSTGYPAESAWFYETLPDYEGAQRIGLDSFGITPERSWRKIYRPQPLPRRNMNALRRVLGSGLPIMAELAIEEYSHAWFPVMDDVNPSERCWFSGYASGLPYSVVTREGALLWNTIWRIDAEYYAKLKTAPFAYRIFANVDFFDASPFAGSLFTRELSAQYGSAAKLNAEYGAGFTSLNSISTLGMSPSNVKEHVLYLRFLERKFADISRDAAATIRTASKNPQAAVGFQPRAIRTRGVDIFTAAAHSHILYAPPHGHESPAFVAKYMLSIADGKPIVAPDLAMPTTSDAAYASLVERMARGYSIALVDEWRRDARKWIRYGRDATGSTALNEKATEQAGMAEAKLNPGNFMNPYAVPTDAFRGIRDAKAAALVAADLFAPQNIARGTHVAVMHSRPSDRLLATPAAIQSTPHDSIEGLIDALAEEGFKSAIILEEQLGTSSTNGLQTIFATGSSFAAYPETARLLSAFAFNGGTVVVSTNALLLGELGMPAITSPDGIAAGEWEPQVISGVAVAARKIGEGRAIRLPSIPDAAMQRKLIAAILAQDAVAPTWQSLDPATGAPNDKVEVLHAKTVDGKHAMAILNHDTKEAEVRLKLTDVAAPVPIDTVSGKLIDVSDGSFAVSLAPGSCRLVTVAAD